MYNDLFSIGGLTVHGYGLCIGIGIAAALLLLVCLLNVLCMLNNPLLLPA